MARYTMVIHGGAGTISKKEMTKELEEIHMQGLREALQAGYEVLEKGGTAMDAVQASVVSLEDNVLFNAGRGSVFSAKGLQEMDAAIMDGKNLKAGAVAAVRNVRNPIKLATEVLQNCEHVLLSGNGANEFAIKQGIPLEPDEYFYSQFRYDQLKKSKDQEDHSIKPTDQHVEELLKGKKMGTVGAVAYDSNGNVASATSTGGTTNKKFGRIGDSPIIGSGTYANNNTCAISCTGDGEMFIRTVAAYDISCLMEYKGMNLQEAMKIVVHDKLMKIEGEGGIIGVDTEGNYSMDFNSEGMYRGAKSSDGAYEISIYK